MFIKAYFGALKEKMSIIENCTDVIVDACSYTGAENGFQFENERQPKLWVELEDINDANISRYKFIDYNDNNGIRTRLRVGGIAYICNNDGKTIEKVVAE